MDDEEGRGSGGPEISERDSIKKRRADLRVSGSTVRSERACSEKNENSDGGGNGEGTRARARERESRGGLICYSGPENENNETKQCRADVSVN